MISTFMVHPFVPRVKQCRIDDFDIHGASFCSVCTCFQSRSAVAHITHFQSRPLQHGGRSAVLPRRCSAKLGQLIEFRVGHQRSGSALELPLLSRRDPMGSQLL